MRGAPCGWVRAGGNRLPRGPLGEERRRIKRSSRADVVSSFTVVKGAMIDETYAVFAAWDFARTKCENRTRVPSRKVLRIVR